MPRIIKEKRIKRVEVEKVCEGVLCEFCGRRTTDHGTGPGVIDWGPNIGEECTVCWAMWEECESGEDMKEIVMCPDCFLKLEKLIPEIRNLMGIDQ